MKRVVSILVVAAFALAATLPALAAGKTHDVKAEIVSVDVEKKMVTIKDEKGANKTVPVLASAVASLKDLKPGDHVMLTCQDDDSGQHQGVAGIKVEKAEKKG